MGLLPGKFEFVQLFWGVLIRSHLFSGLLESLATLYSVYMRFTCPIGFRAFLAHPHVVLYL